MNIACCNAQCLYEPAEEAEEVFEVTIVTSSSSEEQLCADIHSLAGYSKMELLT